MNKWYVDDGYVTHSWRGFEWRVQRTQVLPWLVGQAIEGALAAIGHPCCNRGLGRVYPIFLTCRWVLDQAVRLQEGPELIYLPLTSAQARTLSDGIAEELDDPEGLYYPLNGVDNDGDEWQDGRFVALHCGDCGQRIPVSTWPTEAEQQHRKECPART